MTAGRAARVTVGLVVVVTVPVLLSACVGAAPSLGSYEGKAGATAQDMRSAVETARTTVALARSGRAFRAYLSEVFRYAEDDATAIQAAFDSIQPPDGAADDLRTRLDDLLSHAVSTLSDLRIAARRGDLGSLLRAASPLAQLSSDLDAFSTRLPPGGPP